MPFLKSNFRLRPPLSSIDSRLNYSGESLSTQGNGNETDEEALELLCRITARTFRADNRVTSDASL